MRCGNDGRGCCWGWRSSAPACGDCSGADDSRPIARRRRAGRWTGHGGSACSVRQCLRRLPPAKIKSRPLGGFFIISGGERGLSGASLHPIPMRVAPGTSLRLSGSAPAEPSNPGGASHYHPSARKRATLWALCVCLAERIRTPKRGLDAYTLSRRAPSTTRTPLRIPATGKRLSRGADSSGRRGRTQAPRSRTHPGALLARGWTGMAQWNIRWKTVA